jgi:large subunit ribosomal protein L29
MVEAREIRDWTTDEIEHRLDEAHRELFALRRQLDLGRLEDFNQIKRVKRDIARMKTIVRERELIAEMMADASAEEAR